MSEGLRKLYLACTQNSCFPGPLPEVLDGDEKNVSIHAILQCLGVIPNPNENQSPQGSHRKWEDQVFGLGSSPKSNEDVTIHEQPKTQDSPGNSLGYSSDSNEQSLRQLFETKDHDHMDSNESFSTQEFSSRGPSSSSNSTINSPLFALPGSNAATFPDAIFPHVLASPLERIDYSHSVTPMDQYADFSRQFAMRLSHSPSLESLQTTVPESAINTKQGSSYLLEREWFYRSLFGSPTELQNCHPPVKDYWPTWEEGAAAQFVA
jgi:hypothetical protein